MQLEAQRVVADQVPLTGETSRLVTFGEHVRPGGAGSRLFAAMDAYASAVKCAPAAHATEQARRALENGEIFAEQAMSAAPYGAVLVLMFADELDDAERALAHARRDADRRGVLFGLVLSIAFRGRLALLRGDVSAAEADLRSAFELLRR